MLPGIVEAETAGVSVKKAALAVAAWAHYLVRCVQNHHVIRDEKARLIEVRMRPVCVSSVSTGALRWPVFQYSV
jgi:hypothetical protein